MTSEEILKEHHLKNTGCRKHILNELLKTESALSENEIKTSLPDLFDRVTFYRSLKTLEENKIIHRVLLNDNTIKYALNKAFAHDSECNCKRKSAHIHQHAHFHCTNCDEVTCVDAVLDNPLHLPIGYSVTSTQILLEGTCVNCKK